ncbi:VOC family protein [Pseudohalioglobus lutimaris]|uniref:VOC family virulence protein n=1 Tax=Pseudohalioglobus lutimaris TaxID=1737061 RepID=A0A2N5WYB9_9GAMM|nr:VOC family protein [Pseudohalioglobus lutimaris]PLW67243.1 VOC family virulence protein [Pseudohalioglobus lutimaris]
MHTANPINITVIDHVVIRANDMDRMIAFYSDVLGCRLERGPGEIGLAQMRAGRSLIDLVDSKGPLGLQGGGPPDHTAANMDHLCLCVDPWHVDTIEAHLDAHGIEREPVEMRYGATGMGPSIYLQDPEGNRVELKGSAR